MCSCSGDVSLEKAYEYKNKSINKLTEYLENWADEYTSLTKTEREKLSNLQLNGYLVYEEFYKQNNYFKKFIKDTSSLYLDEGYFFVQNNLTILITKEFNKESSDSLNIINKEIIYDFRPNLENCKLKVLYLSDKYMSMFSNFLKGELINNNNAIKVNTDEIHEILNRVEFLRNKISIVTNDWLEYNYWAIESHPTISFIEFDEDFDEAYVHFIKEYNWGESKFILTKGKKWEMIYSKIIGG